MPTQPTLSLLHLYATEMNLYGDRGNVLALLRHCQWRGITLHLHTAGRHATPADMANHHLYMWGGGQDAQQLAIMADLHTHKADPLRQAHAQGATFLGICGGYQLLGHGYTPHQGQRLLGLGLLDVDTIAGHNRHIGNVVATPTAEALATLGQTTLPQPAPLVGFENHSGITTLGELAIPLARVQQGAGNNGQDGFEGACQGRVLGTYLHGPLLPKNPWLTDALLGMAWAYATGNSVEDEANPFRQPLSHLEPWTKLAHQQASLIASV